MQLPQGSTVLDVVPTGFVGNYATVCVTGRGWKELEKDTLLNVLRRQSLGGLVDISAGGLCMCEYALL